MKAIPIEIWIQIFRLLHQRDKLECMVVCHEWENAIKSTVLFETLQIKSEKGLQSVMARVFEEPSYGRQVKRILLEPNHGDGFDISLLPKFLPNVYDCLLSISIRAERSAFQPWHSKLRRLIDACDHQIKAMLKSSVWSKLTTLTLAGEPNNYDSRDYIPILANTPALRDLTLLEMDFTLDDFQSLHSMAPSLYSLSLIDINVDVSNPPIDVTPAPLIACLSISSSSVNNLVSRKKLLVYISQKYQNVSELSIDINVEDSHDDDDTYTPGEEWNIVLTNLARCLRKLDIQLLSHSEYNHILQTIIKNNVGLESLTLNPYNHCNVHNLLARLSQANYILSLDLRAPHYGSYQWLNSLKMLTELSIGSYRNAAGTRTIQLNEFLDMCGENLEALSFRALILEYRPLAVSNTPPSVYHQIKKLEFIQITLPHDIDTFISSSFPQLHTLKFTQCFDTKKEKQYFMLPNTNLHYLQILGDFVLEDNVLVLTICNNEKRMYTASRSGHDFYILEDHFGLRDASTNPMMISVPFDNKPVSPFLTIVCNSLKDIVLFGD